MPATHPPLPGPTTANELIAAGEAHELAGELHDAIAAYSAALRIAPDGVLAHRIVRLRHDAFPAQTSPPAGSWPPRLPDPFPHVDGIPEVGPGRIDAPTLGGSILHHGCLVVRGMLAPDETAALRWQVARAIEARDRILAGHPQDGDGGWYREFEPRRQQPGKVRRWVQEAGGMLTADAPLVLCNLLDLAERAGIVDAITGHLGERPAVSFDKCVLRRIQGSHATWHQDGSFLGPGVRSVDLWISLTDCGPGTSAPGLDLVPGRTDELLATQTHGAVFPYSIGHGLVEETVGAEGWISPRFAAGDALLFDERLVHRTGGGEFAEERYAAETWFFAPSAFPPTYVPLVV